MSELPPCTQCNSPYTYTDGDLYVCPECAHEWSSQTETKTADQPASVKDSNGNDLIDGDTVSVIKDLKIRGTNSVVKVGTRVKNIRIVDGDHNIDCKVDGVGPMKLKSEFVKKA